MLSSSMKQFLRKALSDDIAGGDVTSALVPLKPALAVIVCKSDGILAGVEESRFLFESHGVRVKSFKKDGQSVQPGDVVMELSGPSRRILESERTALNVLGRMSGVASLTAQAVSLAGKDCSVAATRKTLPGFNDFDKKAVVLGGGLPHRRNLHEMILLKENHLFFFKSVPDAVSAAKKHARGKAFEAEVETPVQALQAAHARVPILMLDNFSVSDARRLIPRIRVLSPSTRIELSGGINLNNLKSYSSLKPDWVSLGALTKNAVALDFSLEVV
ncbi:MAG: carboxylating nicotinate-nucleotide diphosphorylase [Candidatus Diapherotrites archaeon]|nr:carboxylating nicotinate-nucleotide diphosphorylase [Candidatus Diapherotrites archaeon]